MKVTYQIHNDLKHCSANYDGKLYSFRSLKILFETMNKDLFKEINSLNFNEPNIDDFRPKDPYVDFEKSNLSDEERKKLAFLKKQSKAKSWISSMRRKRKSGKLTQNQIDVLNEVGMLWDPTNDSWEKNYDFIKKGSLIDYIKTTTEETNWGEKRLDQISQALDWIDNQRLLFKNGTIPKENSTRLKAINFSFKNSEIKISHSTLLNLFCRICNLRSDLSGLGIKGFLRRYKVKEKAYVGSPIKVSENFIISAYEKYQKQAKKDKLESIRYKEVRGNQRDDKSEKALAILATKSSEYFKNQIDKTSDIGLLSFNQKNNYYFSLGKKVFSYQKKYNDRYGVLNKIMDGYFMFPKTRLNNIVYESVEVEYFFDDEIKEYTAKKMIHILDEFLLKSGIFNKQKSITPISFLMKLYKKDKNLEGLLGLKKLIERHELLNLLYQERLLKVYENLKR